MDDICYKEDSHLLQGQRGQKVFVVNEFYFYYKEHGMEGVRRNGISQVLQRE